MSTLTISPSSLDTGSLFAPSSNQQTQISQAQIAQLLQLILAVFSQAVAAGGAAGGAAGFGNHSGSDRYPSDTTADTPMDVSPATHVSSVPSTSSSTESNATPSALSRDASIANNAGGVPQAAAVSGISPASSVVVHTGTGNDKFFNVMNDTSRTESFTYSVQGQNKGTITLAPGQAGTFVAAASDIGTRVSPSDPHGATHPNEVLQEDGGGNPDISKVDGPYDFYGNEENMTETLSNGRSSGDGDKIRPYLFSTDDAAAMGLAGDKSNTVNIVMSDKH